MVAVRGGVAWERPDVVALGVRGVPGGEGSAVMAVVGSSAGGVWGGTYCGGNGEGVEGRRGVVAAGRGPEEPPLWWQWGSPAGVGGGALTGGAVRVSVRTCHGDADAPFAPSVRGAGDGRRRTTPVLWRVPGVKRYYRGGGSGRSLQPSGKRGDKCG